MLPPIVRGKKEEVPGVLLQFSATLRGTVGSVLFHFSIGGIDKCAHVESPGEDFSLFLRLTHSKHLYPCGGGNRYYYLKAAKKKNKKMGQRPKEIFGSSVLLLFF